MKRAILAMTFLTVLLAWALPAQALMFLHRNLESLTGDADRIFVGTVKEVRAGEDEAGHACDTITFKVGEIFKGSLGETVTIKQVSTRSTLSPDGKLTYHSPFVGVPQFQEGEELLVFLSADSEIGFTTTVGFGQGKFAVLTDEFGDKKLVNGLNNAGLFKGMSVKPAFKSQGLTTKRFEELQKNPKNLYLEQMRSLIRGLVQ